MYTGFLSEIGTKLRDWAVGQAWGSCYSWAASSSNDSKTLYLKTNETITIFTASSHFSCSTSFERSRGIGGGRQRCGRRQPRWPRWQWRSRDQRSTTTHSGRTSGKLRCATDISCRMEILHPESACILYKMVVTGGCGCTYASIFNQ